MLKIQHIILIIFAAASVGILLAGIFKDNQGFIIGGILSFVLTAMLSFGTMLRIFDTGIISQPMTSTESKKDLKPTIMANPINEIV